MKETAEMMKQRFNNLIAEVFRCVEDPNVDIKTLKAVVRNLVKLLSDAGDCICALLGNVQEDAGEQE